jgi:bifunctional DNA-binding transcriptional regulator/antitoxin component of YhaV-PrlF toxin-antitoxin module
MFAIKIEISFTFFRKLFGSVHPVAPTNHTYMKKTQFLPVLILVGLVATLTFGCKKHGPPSAGRNPGQQTVSSFVPAEKTSFNEVTSQLDAGGEFYLYLGTAQWLDGLSGKIGKWRDVFNSMPDMKDEDRANMNKAFDVVTRLIKDSGIEDVSGVGLSSIQIEKGLYRNKALLHHYPGGGDGFLWKMLGKEPHDLTGLDLLPANTALAVFSDMDVPLLWSVAKDEAARSGFPQAQEMLQKLPGQFQLQTQVNWDQFLNSLGGEFGFVLTLDDAKTVTIPLPTRQRLQIPEPGLLIVVKVNDDTIFNRIDAELKKNPQVIGVDKTDLKMRTMPVPIPLPLNVRPTAASSGGYLFIASSDALVEEALAVKSGQKPGLKSTDEFKRLSQNIPDQGNQFTFMSQRFGKTLFEIQQQAVSSSAMNGSSPASAQWMQSLFGQRQAAFSYSVGANTPDGCMTVGNGSQSASCLVLLPAVAVPGMLAAIAIPNFVKARATSQQNACINNLRQLDAAKNEWALEKARTATDIPTKEDLLPYLRKWPVCPDGGTYSLNAVGEPPTCSVPGHKLP